MMHSKVIKIIQGQLFKRNPECEIAFWNWSQLHILTSAKLISFHYFAAKNENLDTDKIGYLKIFGFVSSLDQSTISRFFQSWLPSPFQVENIIFDSDGGIGFQKFRCENIHLMKYQKKDTKFILHSLLYIHFLRLT